MNLLKTKIYNLLRTNIYIDIYFSILIMCIFFSSDKFFKFIRPEDFLCVLSIFVIYKYLYKYDFYKKFYFLFGYLFFVFFVFITLLYHFFVFSEIFIKFTDYKIDIYEIEGNPPDYIFFESKISNLIIKFFPILRLLSAMVIFSAFFMHFYFTNIKRFIYFIHINFLIIFSLQYIFIYYQLFTKNFYGYHGGISIFGELSPFISSYLVCILIIISHLLLNLSKNMLLKFFYIFFIISGLLAVLSLDSRGQIIFIFFYFFIYILFTGQITNPKFIILILSLFIIIIIMFLFLGFNLKGADFTTRFTSLNLLETKLFYASARYGNWMSHLYNFFQFGKELPVFFLTGLGFGGNYILYNQISSASDNNYLSLFYQTGIFGLIFFGYTALYFIRYILKNISIKNYRYVSIFIAFLFSNLIVTFNTHEVLFVGKTNLVFFITLSLLSIVIYKTNDSYA